MPKAGKTQTANDYAANMAHISMTKGQSVPVEKGNNAGPRAVEATKGEIDIKGTPDFMGATPDAAGK